MISLSTLIDYNVCIDNIIDIFHVLKEDYKFKIIAQWLWRQRTTWLTSALILSLGNFVIFENKYFTELENIFK